MIHQKTATRKTCIYCGRHAATGRDTPLGWAGPHCARKHAALPAFLKDLGLSDDGGPLTLPAEQVPGGRVLPLAEYRQLPAQLLRAGLRLHLLSFDAEAGTGTYEIRMHARKRASAHLQTYAERRQQFADELQAASDKRRAGTTR